METKFLHGRRSGGALEKTFEHEVRQKLDGTPGKMTEWLGALDPAAELAPEITVALHLSCILTNPDSSRRILEDAAIAQIQTRFMWNGNDKTVDKNIEAGIISDIPGYEEMLAMARAELQFCLNSGHLTLNGPILVWGAGLGHFVLAIQELGGDAVGIDPHIGYMRKGREDGLKEQGKILPEEERKAFEAVLPYGADEYIAEFNEKKFLHVIASNFHPFAPPDLRLKRGDCVAYCARTIAALTKPEGSGVIGISSTDSDMIMAAPAGVFNSAFDKLKVSACRDSEHFTDFTAVNGQVAYINFWGPKTTHEESAG